MSTVTTPATAVQSEPPGGIDDALRAAASGHRVHPIGTDPDCASCDPGAIRKLWEGWPDAGVAFAGMTFEGLSGLARQGWQSSMAVADMLREAGTLPPMQREQILRSLKASTGSSMIELRRELEAVTGAKLDDLALARMAIEEIGEANILYATNGFWHWTASGVWKPLDLTAFKQLVQRTLARLHVTVTASKVSSVTDVARNELYRAGHRFNLGTPDTINCLNGELELSAGVWSWHAHRRELYRTTQIPAHYSNEATAPLFHRFLTDAFRDDSDRDAKIQCVLELIGYTLMSHARHERFVMLIGSGANGKSVLLSIVRAIAGYENVAGVQPSKFASPFQRAHLHMMLANIVTELKQGEVIADAELKAITSGEVTTVEHKHGTPFEMTAFATCWFGTNHMPHTRDFSDALFRRATILTFNRTFAPAEQDPYLKDRLLAELPGILLLALVAYQSATINRFTAPPSSESAKGTWRREADQVAQFVDERCVADPAARVAVAEIYRVFKAWATDGGVRNIVGRQAMGDRLDRLGFARVRSNGSWITGLRFTTQ